MLKSYIFKLFAFATLLAAATNSFAQSGTVTVTSPAGIAGEYYGRIAAFGPQTFSITGDVVLVDDGGGVTNGCNANPIANDVSGKIALIDRGVCAFVEKVNNAQTAGAIAVIVCNNNVGSPYQAFTMGGTDPNVVIPSIMLGYGDCLKIKTGLVDGVQATINDGGAPDATSGQVCDLAETVTPGSYTIDSIVGGFGAGTIAGGVGHARWYAYTPAATVAATVQTCGQFVDTRLWVVEAGADDCANFGALVGASDDDCDEGAGFGAASTSTWLAVAGTKYLIVFDDRWDYHGFTWTLSEATPPNVVATVTVDMQYETIDPAGAYIAGTFNNWTAEPMTNNGDLTYSFSASVQAGSLVQWKYLNGPNGWESSPALEACGVSDGFGGFNRAGVVNSLDSAFLDAVCFNSCVACTPTDCADPIEIIEDNIDSYTEGQIGPQSPHWTTWSGVDGTAEEGIVSTEQASSAPNSVKIEGTAAGGGPQDCILKLGEKTNGHYILAWDMFIPTGKQAYYNIQHTENTAGAPEWGLETNFNANGVGSLAVSGGPIAFSYPANAWFPVVHYIDLDNDVASIYVNNRFVYSWQFSDKNDGTAGALNLGSIDFFPRNTNDKFYVDDVYYAALPPAGEGQYCHTAIPIDVGVHDVAALDCNGGIDVVDAPAAKWYAYTATADGFISVSSCGLGTDTRVWILSGTCGKRLTNGINDDECAMSTGADLYASYRETAVTAGTTYYIVWDDRWDANPFSFELAFFTDIYPGDFCETAIEVTPGQYTIDYFAWAGLTGPIIGAQNAVATPTPYTQSKWYSYTPTESGEAIISSCGLTTDNTRVWVYTGTCGSFSSLTQVGTNDNSCGTQSSLTIPVTAGTTYYIEWDDRQESSETHDWQLEFAIPTSEVTFRVDMALQTIDPAGAFIAGSFNGWTDGAMTNTSGTIWEATIELPVGADVTWKFKNGPGGWENNPDLEDCGINDGAGNINRLHTVGDANETLALYCFNYCLTCAQVGTEEDEFAAAIGLNPNPADGYVNVTYNFEQAADLNIRLVNSLGQLLSVQTLDKAQNGSLRLDLSTLPAGAYNVVFSNGDQVATKRLIVE